MSLSFQEIIATLNSFWSDRGCVIVQPYDTEKGAGTMSHQHFSKGIRSRALVCGIYRTL